MSHLYGWFDIVESIHGTVEINDNDSGRWVEMPEEDFRNMVLEYADYFSKQEMHLTDDGDSDRRHDGNHA